MGGGKIDHQIEYFIGAAIREALCVGSVLGLLIAVPSHVVARQRGDSSAPMVTSFGIATGIAIMLLSFGPGVLLLYKKRLNDYANRTPAAKSKGVGS
jgi:hypothetical protein